MGDIDGAIKAFCRATFINPQDADAHYNLGVLLSKQGRLDDAAENYIKSMKCNRTMSTCIIILVTFLKN